MDRNEKKIALNKQVNDFTEELKSKAGEFQDLGKNVLVIGGIIVAGYALMKLFNDDEEEIETEVAPTVQSNSILSSALKGAASSLLLAMAKNKLSDFLEGLNEEGSEQDS